MMKVGGEESAAGGVEPGEGEEGDEEPGLRDVVVSGFAAQISGDGPETKESVGEPEDPRGVEGKLEEFDAVAVSEENAGEAGGDP